MKKNYLLIVLLISVIHLAAQNPDRFKPDDLTIVGTYYYPEHWDESQWERDLKQIKELGFEFVHYAEFAW